MDFMEQSDYSCLAPLHDFLAERFDPAGGERFPPGQLRESDPFGLDLSLRTSG